MALSNAFWLDIRAPCAPGGEKAAGTRLRATAW